MGTMAEVHTIRTPLTQIEGSDEWAKKIRRRARELSNQVQRGYVELSEILWSIYNVPRQGDSMNGPIYTQWGWNTFGEYVEKELSLSRRKAEYLRKIGMVLNERLSGIDPELKKRLTDLGWSKLRELVVVLTTKNVVEWVDRAEKVNFPELLTLIRRYLDQRKEKQLMKDSVNAGGGGTPDGEGDSDVLPATERVRWEHFQLQGEQCDSVEEALQRAKELSKSEVKSNNLSLICLDFLASNSFGKTNDPKVVRKYLERIAAGLNLKIVAFDPQTSELVCGEQNVNDLVQLLVKGES